MSRKSDPFHFIRSIAEAHFGAPVLDIKTPGGSSRASCRLVFADQTVIATKRPNFRRTHLEATVLRQLSAVTDKVPRFLGLVDDVLFQGDLGAHRLNKFIHEVTALEQEDLADQAVAAIFDIQKAAHHALADVPLPPLGVSENWVTALVDAADALAPFGLGVPDHLDRAALFEALQSEPVQFVKWDCRSGNATLDDNGHLGWFDFEYCGRRHGAEDLAFLIADEAWPLAPDVMLNIVAENFRDNLGRDQQGYMDYLSLYTTFHALQRLRLIVDETKKRGWRSKTRVLDRDDVGKHPDFAANICSIGRFFADRHALTRPLVPGFEAARDTFLKML